ncbi:transcription antitermination factor NusB [Thiothrix nivea]|uniref:Transcription antitermination protein NusB n=1 Tax=Thiothrix nivea (strain ATCC 35100 / DSM 5205 / JP2) TaxID=870187 RepID=A0A656HER6_THINJ|nr:transcription antitermination factor NusB [Thiothrix nivea]EIJ33535.1 NusB antitermination factor [Thiothrix nivea DSM 5205]
MAGRKPLTDAQQLIARRRVARRLAMQGAYQWLITGNEFQEIYLYFQEEPELAAEFRKSDAAFFHKLLRCAIEGGEELESRIAPHLDRKLFQVDPIEHAVLRVATCELLNHIETPYKVVVNEYVNLAKKFGAEQAHKFINGVLDKVAADIRPLEVPGKRK